MADQTAGDNEWEASVYDSETGFVHEYGESVVDLLDPQSGERVLDLGSGTGHLTAEIASAVGPDGAVVGVDSAPDMVREARESYPDLPFVEADVREFDPAAAPGPDSFDAVFSNAVLHWIPPEDQQTVAERVGELLAPGGRFAAELGGVGNVSTILDAVMAEVRERGYEVTSPWYFPTVGEHATLLEASGFEVRLARLFDRPTALDGQDGLATWLDVFGDTLFADLTDAERRAVVSAVEDRLRGALFDPETETWTADYRRLRFLAVRA